MNNIKLKDILIEIINNNINIDNKIISNMLILILENININDLIKLSIDTLYDINMHITNIENKGIKNKVDICFSSKLVMTQVNNRITKNRHSISNYSDKLFFYRKQYNHILYYKIIYKDKLYNINKCRYCFRKSERIILLCKKCCEDKFFICNECALHKICLKIINKRNYNLSKL